MRILMIEDQPHFSGLVRNMLEGVDIDVAETMAEAKNLLRENRYDLILVDLGLPDSDGVGTLRALKDRKTPKVVLTGRFDLVSEAAELGCADYVYKTMELSDLYERLMFNISKVERVRRPRFSPEVFGQIRACFERPVERELTYA